MPECCPEDVWGEGMHTDHHEAPTKSTVCPQCAGTEGIPEEGTHIAARQDQGGPHPPEPLSPSQTCCVEYCEYFIDQVDR